MHDHLLNAAKKAIDNLFADLSVEPETTLSDMKELRDEIDIKIDAMEMDGTH